MNISQGASRRHKAKYMILNDDNSGLSNNSFTLNTLELSIYLSIR